MAATENQKAYQRNRYATDPEFRERVKRRSREHKQRVREDLRSFIREWKERTPCADCGGFFPHFVMEFDHRGDKFKNVALMLGSYPVERIALEVAKCDLVCANCHAIRTHRRRGETNGSEPAVNRTTAGHALRSGRVSGDADGTGWSAVQA